MRDPGLRSEHRAELQVGGLVLASLAALVAGVIWITGTDVTGQRYTLHAVTETAARVSEGGRVYVRGVDVGSVRRVHLAGDRVLLDLDLTSDVSLPRDSRAVIESSGFLGNQILRIVPGRSTETLAPGDTLAAATSPDLQGLATSLGEQAESVLSRASRLLSDSTVGALQGGASDLSASMADLRRLVESERETLHRLIENLEATSGRLSRAASGPHLENTVARLDTLTRRLAAASDDLDASSRSLASILQKVDAGRGSLGRLVNDDRLYDRAAAAAENLRSASEEIGLLTRDIRKRPERYLRELKFSVF